MGLEMWGAAPRAHRQEGQTPPESPDERRPITTTTLRVPLRKLLAETWGARRRAIAAELVDLDNKANATERKDRFDRYAKLLGPPRRGRRPLSAEHLDRVDAIAKQARENGISPERAVKDALGPISNSRARGWIREAAQRKRTKPPPRVSFKQVAAVALAAEEAGDSPTRAVQDYFRTSERYAAAWIERAIERGYMMRTRGKLRPSTRRSKR